MKTYNYNSNDIVIFRAIYNEKEQRGMSLAKGSTIEDILRNLDLEKPLSEAKVRATVRKLKEDGYIAEGIKVVNLKTYYITIKGLELLEEITNPVGSVKEFFNEEE